MEKYNLEQKIKAEIARLWQMSERYISSDIAVHEIEKGILLQLLSIGLLLLKFIIASKEPSTRGYEVADLSSSVINKGMNTRKYLSIFGQLEISRMSYWEKEVGTFYKLDEHLSLPHGSQLSYNLQEWLGDSASESDYRESVVLLNKILGLSLNGSLSKRNINRLGSYVDPYYESVDKVPIPDALCFSASFDGKGVPKIKPLTASSDNPKKRLSKGEKLGKKQMATVVVTSSFTPKPRTIDSILKALVGSPLSPVKEIQESDEKSPPNDNQWHQNIHRRAMLDDQERAIDYGIFNIKERMTDPNSRFVVPIDAGIGLEDKVLARVEQYGLKEQFDGIILDIIHVSEYVWNAATAIFGEKSVFRREWVLQSLSDILNSRTDLVINELIKNRDKTKLTEKKVKTLNKAITYFTNHQHKMDYQAYLKKGYPVSSALVESACGHLVKERMEQSGMRWEDNGAQSMMDIRAVKQNDDTNEFMAFTIKMDRKVILKNIAA